MEFHLAVLNNLQQCKRLLKEEIAIQQVQDLSLWKRKEEELNNIVKTKLQQRKRTQHPKELLLLLLKRL